LAQALLKCLRMEGSSPDSDLAAAARRLEGSAPEAGGDELVLLGSVAGLLGGGADGAPLTPLIPCLMGWIREPRGPRGREIRRASARVLALLPAPDAGIVRALADSAEALAAAAVRGRRDASAAWITDRIDSLQFLEILGRRGTGESRAALEGLEPKFAAWAREWEAMRPALDGLRESLGRPTPVAEAVQALLAGSEGRDYLVARILAAVRDDPRSLADVRPALDMLLEIAGSEEEDCDDEDQPSQHTSCGSLKIVGLLGAAAKGREAALEKLFRKAPYRCIGVAAAEVLGGLGTDAARTSLKSLEAHVVEVWGAESKKRNGQVLLEAVRKALAPRG